MKKILVFTGQPKTGKTLLSRMLFKQEETVYIDGGTDFPISYLRYELDPRIKHVILDDLYVNVDMSFLNIFLHSTKVKVEKKGSETTLIPTPLLVISTTDPFKTKYLKELSRQIEIVDFDKLTFREVVSIIERYNIMI